MEFTELFKLINKSTVRDLRNHKLKEIEAAIRKGVRIKTTKRKLCAGKSIMHAVKDRQGNIVINFNDIAKVAEGFYLELYSSNTRHPTGRVISADQDRQVSCVTADEARKAAGEGGITADLIKDEGDFLTRNLATLYTKCLKASSVPVS